MTDYKKLTRQFMGLSHETRCINWVCKKIWANDFSLSYFCMIHRILDSHRN